MKKKLKRRRRRGIAIWEVTYKAPVIETAGWCRGRPVSQRKRKRLRADSRSWNKPEATYQTVAKRAACKWGGMIGSLSTWQNH